MPSNSTSYSSGVVTLTSGLPINNVTGILLYTYTDGNGGGNSTGTDVCTIYQFQAEGPQPIYADSGLSIGTSLHGIQRIGTVPLTTATHLTNNLRIYQNGVVNAIPLLPTSDPGASNVRVCFQGGNYSLPNAAYTPNTNLSVLPGSSYAWSGGFGSVYSSGFNYGWSYSGGGSNGSGYLYSYFSQPYTLSQVIYNLYMFAYGYGNNWQTYYVQYNIYYTTSPVGSPSPNWIQLYEYNQGSH